MSIDFPGPANAVDPNQFKKGGSGGGGQSQSGAKQPSGGVLPSDQQIGGSFNGKGLPSWQALGIDPNKPIVGSMGPDGRIFTQADSQNYQPGQGPASHLTDSQISQLVQMYNLPFQTPDGSSSIPPHPAFNGTNINQSQQQWQQLFNGPNAAQDHINWLNQVNGGGSTPLSANDLAHMSFGQVSAQGVQDHINWLNNINSTGNWQQMTPQLDSAKYFNSDGSPKNNPGVYAPFTDGSNGQQSHAPVPMPSPVAQAVQAVQAKVAGPAGGDNSQNGDSSGGDSGGSGGSGGGGGS